MIVSNYLRKALGILAATTILCTNTTFAVTSVDNSESVVYSLQNLSANDGSKIVTTQADIINGHWDLSALGDVSPEIYKDFPMIFSNTVDEHASLNLSFRYLKIIGNDDTVTFTVTERDTEQLYFRKTLSTNDTLVELDDIPINKVYNVSISERLSGEMNVYETVIRTYLTNAEMPSNVSLYSGVTENNNIIAENVMVGEISEEPDKVIEDDNGDVFVIPSNNSLERYSLTPEEFSEWYSALDNEKLYRIQTEAFVDGFMNYFTGYFSKSADLIHEGIFIPSCTLYNAADYENCIQSPMPLSISAADILNERVEYDYMEDAYFSLPHNDKRYIVIGFVFPETGSYTIETIGDTPTYAEYWRSHDGTPSFSRMLLGNGNNFSQTTTIAENELRYWVIYFEKSATGKSIFRIKANDYSSERSNSIYETEHSGVYIENEEELPEVINYKKDVDIFYIENVTDGEYGIRVKNTSQKPLEMTIYERLSADSSLWTVATREVRAGKTVTSTPSFRGGNEHYFLRVRSKNIADEGQAYTVYIITPETHDPYEPNDTRSTATDLIALKGLRGTINDLTLHKYDVDYFKFTTGPYGSDFYIWLNEVNYMQYNMELYKGEEFITDAKAFDGTEIDISDLEPLTTYYICINNDGMGSNAYSAALKTDLEWVITNKDAPAVSAILNSDVNFSYNANDSITDIDALLTAVMNSLTCYQGTTEIPDATAKNDVQLYYMNGDTKTALTPAVIEGLSVGSYNVIVEYSGVAATGRTVTLTIEEPIQSNIITIPGITASYADFEELDWICAAWDMANIRLRRETGASPLMTVNEAAEHFGLSPDDFEVERKKLRETLMAVSYIYSNGELESNAGFTGATNARLFTVDEVYNKVAAGQASIIQMVDFDHKTDMSYAFYLLICGANKDTQELLVKNYLTGQLEWVSRDSLISGGYDESNTKVKFSGGIIEAVS